MPLDKTYWEQGETMRSFIIFTEKDVHPDTSELNILGRIEPAAYGSIAEEGAYDALLRAAESNGFEDLNYLKNDGLFGKGGITANGEISGIRVYLSFCYADAEDVKNIIDDENYQ